MPSHSAAVSRCSTAGSTTSRPRYGHICWRMCSSNEITHVLQGMTRHSETGIMKAHWDDRDLRKISSKGLAFTPHDVLLIHQEMAARLSRRTGAGARELRHHDGPSHTISEPHGVSNGFALKRHHRANRRSHISVHPGATENKRPRPIGKPNPRRRRALPPGGRKLPPLAEGRALPRNPNSCTAPHQPEPSRVRTPHPNRPPPPRPCAFRVREWISAARRSPATAWRRPLQKQPQTK